MEPGGDQGAGGHRRAVERGTDLTGELGRETQMRVVTRMQPLAVDGEIGDDHGARDGERPPGAEPAGELCGQMEDRHDHVRS
ncbi:hypothetical protein GA0115249_1163134 [Streptomyces sp. PpalLS-921]|nr:hypothetical protein GA0115249_1163134 [Streptomyces sp. PpalLS-921]